MTRLIMDSSTNYLYISLIKDQLEIWKYLERGNNDHSEKLSNLIKTMLTETSIKVDDIDEIIVGKGPGSYTGVRVSMTIAKVFSWAKHIRLLTYSSLDLIASNKLKQDGIYVVKLDARRGNSFFKVIELKHTRVVSLVEDSFSSNTNINELIDKYYSSAILIDQVSESSFDITALEKFKMIHEVKDIYSFVPNYVRSGL
jgi:tRNA threonylcarbamoyladenosine biosynthesis protein TsaB